MLFDVSVSSASVHRSASKEAVAPQPEHRSGPRILIPTSLRDDEIAAVASGLEYVAARRAQAIVLYVGPSEPVGDGPVSWHWLDAIGNLHRALSMQPSQPAGPSSQIGSVRAFIDDCMPPSMKPEDIRIECRTGDLDDEVVAFAAKAKVDMVVLTRKSRSAWWPFAANRLDALVRRLTCPVLLVPTPKSAAMHGMSPAFVAATA